jgi:hypothetical protein
LKALKCLLPSLRWHSFTISASICGVEQQGHSKNEDHFYGPHLKRLEVWSNGHGTKEGRPWTFLFKKQNVIYDFLIDPFCVRSSATLLAKHNWA